MAKAAGVGVTFEMVAAKLTIAPLEEKFFIHCHKNPGRSTSASTYIFFKYCNASVFPFALC